MAKKRAQLDAWDCKCEVCGYEWTSTNPEPPIRCAKCKTPYWDRPKQQDSTAAD